MSKLKVMIPRESFVVREKRAGSSGVHVGGCVSFFFQFKNW